MSTSYVLGLQVCVTMWCLGALCMLDKRSTSWAASPATRHGLLILKKECIAIEHQFVMRNCFHFLMIPTFSPQPISCDICTSGSHLQSLASPAQWLLRYRWIGMKFRSLPSLKSSGGNESSYWEKDGSCNWKTQCFHITVVAFIAPFRFPPALLWGEDE